MKRLAGIFGASLFAFAGACTTGAVGDDTTPGDDTPQDSITCQADLTIVGNLAPTDPQPAEIAGCWPIGTWNFQASILSNTCSTPPTLLTQYAFTGERDLASPDPDYDWIFTVTMPQDPTAEVSVSSGGGGLCSAAFMIYSTDGLSVFNLHPALQAGGTINGLGTYEVHTQDQRPAAP